MSTPETLPTDATEPTQAAGQAQGAADQGRALASLLLALDQPALQPLAASVDLGPTPSTPAHWDVPRASRWRCHCSDCRAGGTAGRRAFSWNRA